MEKTPAINTASKDILAKAMAMEDINVQHSASAKTAWFDTRSRTLCLPVWKDMGSEMYDMLVGHEVGHALYTPADGWSDYVGDDKLSSLRHMMLNIVEDARIERMMKGKFPGLKRDFAKAYKQLSDQDMFEIAGKDISSLPLADRLNIEFKLGLFGLADVTFTPDEQVFVERMGTSKTIEEVQQIAEDLVQLHLDHMEQNPEQAQQNNDGDKSTDGEGESGADHTDNDGKSSSEGAEGGDNDKDVDQTENGASDGDDGEQGSSDDSGQSMDDDTDDGQSAESQQGDKQSDDQEGEKSELRYEDYSNEPCGVGSTQNAFDRAMGDMVDEGADDYVYHAVPKLNLDNIIVGYDRIDNIWSDHQTRSRDNNNDEAIARCDEFISKSRPVVGHMVQRFQMKQAAEVAKKTEVTKTGILNPTTMINYRWSEDIFLKNETHENGQSHGIVMFLDWSGSMSDILKNTIEQLLTMTEFCNKTQIPFEVYAFTSAFRGDDDDERKQQQYATNETANQTNQLQPHRFHLLNFLSSKMDSKQYKKAVQRLWVLAEANDYRRTKGWMDTPNNLGLGCTPLNEAIIASYQIIPEFKRNNDVQIVNAVFLSDGDGHGMGGNGYSGKHFVTNPVTRQAVEVNCRERGHAAETACYLQILKDNTGCNIIGIRLLASPVIGDWKYRYFQDVDSSGNSFFQETEITKAAANYKKNNFFSKVNCEGCDELFVIKGSTKVIMSALEDIDEEASIAKIRNAFIKGNNNKKSSRVIAGRIIDLISV